MTTIAVIHGEAILRGISEAQIRQCFLLAANSDEEPCWVLACDARETIP